MVSTGIRASSVPALGAGGASGARNFEAAGETAAADALRVPDWIGECRCGAICEQYAGDPVTYDWQTGAVHVCPAATPSPSAPVLEAIGPCRCGTRVKRFNTGLVLNAVDQSPHRCPVTTPPKPATPKPSPLQPTSPRPRPNGSPAQMRGVPILQVGA